MEIGENKIETFGVENLSVIQNNYNLELAVEINKDQLSFSIKNEKNEIVRIEQHEFKSDNTKQKTNKIEKIIISNKFLKQNFKSCTLILNNEFFTLIPNKMFDVNNYKKYYDFCFKQDPDNEIIFEEIKNIKSINIYSINKSLKNILLNYFPKIKIIHTCTNLINSISNKINQYENQNILLNINKSNFQIILFHDSDLLLYTYFHYEQEEDFLFYLLYISKELKINQKNSNIYLTGNINSKSTITLLIKKYFQNINFMRIKRTIKLPFFFQNINEHTFYNLLNGHICE